MLHRLSNPPSLLAILALGFALRLIWALLIPVEPISDAAAYQTFATNLVNHGVYGFTPEKPGAYWAVGTAALYAGVYLVFGVGSNLGVVLVNLISGMVVIWAVHQVGRLWFNARVAGWAALAIALWPLLIQYTTVLASELHFIALCLLGLVGWAEAHRRKGLQGWLWLLAGALAFAAATYMRPIALLVPAALAIAALLSAPRQAIWPILRAGLVTALIFAAVAPWSARNERVFGEPVFMSTNFWANFWMGNTPQGVGEYHPLPPETKGMTEIERAHYMKELALADIRTDPASAVWRVLKKSVRLYQRETIGVGWNGAALRRLGGDNLVTGLKVVSTGYFYVVLAMALGGLWFVMRNQGWWQGLLSPTVWLWLYFTAIHAVIVVGDRYHMPAIPFIALLAGFALQHWQAGRASLEDPPHPGHRAPP